MPEISVDRETHIKIGDIEYTEGIESGSMSISRILTDDNIEFGKLNSAMFEVMLYTENDVAGQDISVWQIVREEIPIEETEQSSDSETEQTTVKETKIQLFTGVIESAQLDTGGYYRQIVAYDKAYFVSRVNVADWWENFWKDKEDSATLRQLSNSLLDYVGIEYANTQLPTDDIHFTLKKDIVFNRISFADMLKYILSASVCVPYLDEYGVLQFWKFWAADTVDIQGQYEISNSVIEDYTTDKIDKINFIDSSGTIIDDLGTGNNIYTVDYNPIITPIIQAGLEERTELFNSYSYILGLTYTPSNIKMIVSDPTIPMGAKLQITDTVFSYNLEMTLSGMMLIEQSIVSKGNKDVQDVTESYSPDFQFVNQLVSNISEDVTELQENVTEIEEAVEDIKNDIQRTDAQTGELEKLNEGFANANGLKITTIDEKSYYHNGNTIDNATYIFTMTDEGFAWTDNWNDGNPEWQYGITKDGNAILNYLAINKLNADLIEAGVIKSVNQDIAKDNVFRIDLKNALIELFQSIDNEGSKLLMQGNGISWLNWEDITSEKSWTLGHSIIQRKLGDGTALDGKQALVLGHILGLLPIVLKGATCILGGVTSPAFRLSQGIDPFDETEHDTYGITYNLSDAMWRPVPLNKNITAYNYGGYSTPMYRKVGDRVDIVGAVQVTWSGSGQINLATLPTGYGPKSLHLWVAAAQGTYIARVNITQGGVLRIEYIRNITDGSAATTQRWVELNTSFFILDDENIIPTTE